VATGKNGRPAARVAPPPQDAPAASEVIQAKGHTWIVIRQESAGSSADRFDKVLTIDLTDAGGLAILDVHQQVLALYAPGRWHAIIRATTD
jgi:hypothetical protein